MSLIFFRDQIRLLVLLIIHDVVIIVFCTEFHVVEITTGSQPNIGILRAHISGSTCPLSSDRSVHSCVFISPRKNAFQNDNYLPYRHLLNIIIKSPNKRVLRTIVPIQKYPLPLLNTMKISSEAWKKFITKVCIQSLFSKRCF